MTFKAFLTIAVLLTSVLAKTDLEGCTSFTSMVTVRPEPGYGNTYASIVWYVPDTLEICKGVDCGGGRAPPKKVPGCPLYDGPETVTAEFLTADPMKPTEAAVTTKEEAKETGTVDAESSTTESAVVTTTTGNDGAAAATDSSETAAQKTSSVTGADEEATITDADSPDETGGASAIGANLVFGAAAAALALL